VLWHDGTTGERAPLIRFWPLQRLPVAWPCSGAASLRKSPAAALDSVSSGACVSPLARASPPVRCFAWRVPNPVLGVHPPDGGWLRLPKRVMHRRVPLQRDVPLPASRESSRPGRGIASRDGAPGVRPFAVLTRPARVGAFPPVLPTCRFMADSLRRYRSEDRPPMWRLRLHERTSSSGKRRSIGNHPSRLLGIVHAGQFALRRHEPDRSRDCPGLCLFQGFGHHVWCAKPVSKIRLGRRPPDGPAIASRLQAAHRFRVLSALGFAIMSSDVSSLALATAGPATIGPSAS